MFTLHPQLAADCAQAAQLKLCALLLMDNANFPWLILVPRRSEVRELFELSPDDQAQLMREISAVAQAFQAMTGADKMNIAALGNQVPQLHVHVVARFKDDLAWPNPIWNSGVAPKVYEPVDKKIMLNKLQGLANITKM